MSIGLPPGNWRYDPHRRCQVWVPLDRTKPQSDEVDVLPDFKHGTEYGYRLHLVHGLGACDSCREAMAAATRRRRANRRNRAA